MQCSKLLGGYIMEIRRCCNALFPLLLRLYLLLFSFILLSRSDSFSVAVFLSFLSPFFFLSSLGCSIRFSKRYYSFALPAKQVAFLLGLHCI
jgi:hypothetical protein